MVALSSTFQFVVQVMSWSYNPIYAVTYMVWAIPSSLAATKGIEFSFFSSAYLDVSVQRVGSPITRNDSPSD